MSAIAKEINAFIAFNAGAFKAFSEVAKSIEEKTLEWQLKVAHAGVLPQDYRTFAVAHVFKTTGVEPKPGQRGGWTYTKGTEEYNSVETLCNTLTGKALAKAQKRKEQNEARKTKSALEKVLEAYAALSAADKKAFMKAI